MADKKPIVLESGQLQQLQDGDDLDIPLDRRVDILEGIVKSLCQALLGAGLDIPEACIEYAEQGATDVDPG